MANNRETASVRRKYNRNARWFDSMDRMISDEWRSALLENATGKVLKGDLIKLIVARAPLPCA